MVSQKIRTVFLINFLLTFFSLVFWLYYTRVGSFSFGDEWNNFMAAFFMEKGRTLFSEIFHNHQPIPTYLSFLIQTALHPDSLYKLVLYHRGFVILWSIFFSGLLIYRFRLKGAGFVCVYELTKYYVFGHLFLAEALLVYPLVYLFGLALERLYNRPITKIDSMLSSLFAWLIVFTREPFAPIAIVIYAYLLLRTTSSAIARQSLFVFIVLTAAILLIIGKALPDYVYQVITYNLTVILPAQIGPQSFPGENIAKIIFYPLFTFIEGVGKWNYFRNLLIMYSSIFILFFSYYVIQKKQVKQMVFLLLFLALANLRPVAPGIIFHEAFHMAPWYGVFIFAIFFLGENLYLESKKKIVGYISVGLLLIIILSSFSFQSYIWEKIDRNQQFSVNYAHYYTQGEVIRLLAKPDDTLFADLWDYLIHWQANLDSSYAYAIYIFSMKGSEKYDSEREKMFHINPPDFYYTYCENNTTQSTLLPTYVQNQYVQVYRKEKPSCIYVKKTKIKDIPQNKRKQIEQLEYFLKN